MDVFLIPLIHRWGGGIRPARRRAGGLKGASISDFNGKDGAITSMRDGVHAWFVAMYMSVRLSALSLTEDDLFSVCTGHEHPCLNNHIHFTLLWRIAFWPVVLTIPFYHQCAFLAAWYSLTICSSSSLTLRPSPDWCGGGGLFICTSGNEIFILYAFSSRSYLDSVSVNGTWD